MICVKTFYFDYMVYFPLYNFTGEARHPLTARLCLLDNLLFFSVYATYTVQNISIKQKLSKPKKASE